MVYEFVLYSEWRTIPPHPPKQNICRSAGASITISGAYRLDHAYRKTAEFVVHPDIFAGMQAKIILPEAAGE
jgi:hypothetical protein